jgi:hypothetical protein
MDPKNENIKTILMVIIIILGIEIIFATALFIIKKENQNKLDNSNIIIEDNSIKPITELEKEIILKKTTSPKLPVEIDTNPRTRPLPTN